MATPVPVTRKLAPASQTPSQPGPGTAEWEATKACAGISFVILLLIVILGIYGCCRRRRRVLRHRQTEVALPVANPGATPPQPAPVVQQVAFVHVVAPTYAPQAAYTAPQAGDLEASRVEASPPPPARSGTYDAVSRTSQSHAVWTGRNG
jgi:hypothetical protein